MIDVYYKEEICEARPLIKQCLLIVFQFPESLLSVPKETIEALAENSCRVANLLSQLKSWVLDYEPRTGFKNEKGAMLSIVNNLISDYSVVINDDWNPCRDLNHARQELLYGIKRFLIDGNKQEVPQLARSYDLKKSNKNFARNEGPSPAARLRVLNRDRYTCVYCGRHGSEAELHVDHIQPVANGGSHHISNLQTTCRHCNQSKGKRKAPKTRPETIESSDAEYSKSSVGLWVLTFEPLKEHQKNIPIHRDIRWQGLIIGKEDDFFLVQLYSWWGGSPTHVVALKKSFVFDADQAVMFAEKEDLEEFIEGNKQVKKQTNREAL